MSILVIDFTYLEGKDGELVVKELAAVDSHNIRVSSYVFNPSARGHLNPSSYCDVGRFFSGDLNFEVNSAGVY